MERLVQPFSVRSLYRSTIATILGIVLFMVNVSPALAIGSSPSKPSEGVVQLDKIEQRSEDVLREGPLDMKEVQERSKGGLNEIQGDADRSKMNTPSNSKNAKGVIEKVQDALSQTQK